MLTHELDEAIDIIKRAAQAGSRTAKHKALHKLTQHRLNQINRILRYVRAHWSEEFEIKVHESLQDQPREKTGWW